MNLNLKMRAFDNAGFYFIALLVLAIAGFWPSYFVKFFDGTADFTFYFHFHAFIAGLWILMLIIQPILIKRKKNQLHRILGKFSYLLFFLIFVSVLLLVHSRHSVGEEGLAIGVFIPFKDLIVLGTAFFIAIKYRRKINIHARGMIATGIVFIEPALVRLIRNVFPDLNNRYLWTIFLVYALLVGLMIWERKQKSGRWVFPLILGLYIIVHSIIVFKLPIGFFETFAKWFLGLPLT